ncbi:MAG: GNAT family N-acetyltransferase [Pararhizobium sp.]
MAVDAFNIRPSTTSDLPGLLALYRQLNPEDPELPSCLATERFAEMMSHPGMTVFTSVSGETVTSTATVSILPNLTRGGRPYALIENVVTDARFRKRGHAGAVIRHAVAHAWDKDCFKVMLLTGSQDPATLKFYEGCGFAQNKTGFQIRQPIDI